RHWNWAISGLSAMAARAPSSASTLTPLSTGVAVVVMRPPGSGRFSGSPCDGKSVRTGVPGTAGSRRGSRWAWLRSWRGPSGAVGEQRDAADAVLGRGVPGAVGDEPVFGVLPDGVDAEADGFNRIHVPIALHSAADAGGPERGVAGNAPGELDGGNDVGDGE